MPRHFHEELDALKQTLLAMGGLVEEQIRRVMRALIERDDDLAREVIERDQQVNAYDVEIDEKCVELLALHQPAAGDLRMITTIIKANSDFERIADCAVNIDPDAESLAEIALITASTARALGVEPRVAMLSFSNFGSVDHPFTRKVRRATELAKKQAPDLVIEGEVEEIE